MSRVGLFYIFVLSCVRVEVASSLVALFEDLPHKISDAWTYTWNNVVAAIKRPVEVKRFGKLGKLKPTPTPLPPTIEISLGTENQMGDEYGRIRLHIRTPEPVRHRDENERTFERKFVTTKKYMAEMITVTTKALEVIGFEGPRKSKMSKLTIPHLKPPIWSSLDDWRRLQKPIYGGSVDNVGEYSYTTKTPIKQKQFMVMAPRDDWMMKYKVSDPKLYKPTKLILPLLPAPKDKYSDSWHKLSNGNDLKDNYKRRSIPPSPALEAPMPTTDTTTLETTTERNLHFNLNLHGSKFHFNYKWYINMI